MNTRKFLGAVAAVLAINTIQAQNLDSIAPYQPRGAVTGTITTWGHAFVKDIMKNWEEGFRKYHPDVQFKDNLVSSAAAIGGLYSGVADIGFIGREIRSLDIAAYTRVMGYKPSGIRVMTGSYANADKLIAIGIFVHRDNPLAKLSYSQLDAIFGSERLRGAPQNIRIWGQLGLGGDWAEHPIQVYTGVLDAAPGFYFSQEVLKGSLLWNGDLRHFDDLSLPGGRVIEAGHSIVEALAKDRFGIAMTGAGYRNPNVKLLAVAAQDSGPYVEASRENVANRSYPLTRSVWMFVNHPPGRPVDAKVSEFLHYILSRQGQQAVVREGEYLPLSGDIVQQELQKLE